MNIVRWGIIGAGNVCEKKSGPAFYKIDHSELIAIMRRNEAKAKDYAERHNVMRYYTNAERLINDPEVDIIYVATPPNTHKEYAIKVLQAGKPVYVEKPMALNHAECLAMTQAAKKANQKLFVAYYRRSLPYFLKIKELLENNAIGKILSVDIKYCRPAGTLDRNRQTQTWRVNKDIAGEGYFFDLAPHTLDILDFLLGEISDAKGYAHNLGGFYDVADTITASIRFQSGILGTGQWCFVSSEESRQDKIVIMGTNGYIHFNTFAFQPIRLVTEKGEEIFSPPQPEHIQQPLIQTIVNELRGIGTCPSTGVSGARTSKIMDLIIS